MQILITGSTSGIGKQLALDYLALGHTVFCCGRQKEALAEFTQAYPELSKPLSFDIQDLDACTETLAPISTLDMVILNAGTCEYIDAKQFDAALFKRVFDINVQGVANCLECLLPKMSKGATLAIMGSSSSYVPLPRAEAYGASKAAIEYLTKTLAISLRSQQLHVSYIAPGFVDTPLTQRNDFPMPMRVDVQFAARKIRQGLARHKREIHFPWLFTGALKLLAHLPLAWQSALLARTVQSQS